MGQQEFPQVSEKLSGVDEKSIIFRTLFNKINKCKLFIAQSYTLGKIAELKR